MSGGRKEGQLPTSLLASKFKGSTRMRLKLRIGRIAAAAWNPPLPQQKSFALCLREESARRQERSVKSAFSAASVMTFELGCQ
jgi:hypothetical protein